MLFALGTNGGIMTESKTIPNLMMCIVATLKRGIECASYENASIENIGKFQEEAEALVKEIENVKY